MKVISMINFKGGVGKTSSTHSLGSALTLLGKRVLLIDVDPQASLTYASLDYTPKNTVSDIFLKIKNINECLIKTKDFDLIPSNLILNLVERQLFSKYGIEKILKKAISELNEEYDYIIIDCPPALNLFAINAINTSDFLIVPCETEIFALDGLNLLLSSIENLQEELEIKLEKIMILPTKVDKRRNVSKDIQEHLESLENSTRTSIRICSKLTLLGLEKNTIFEIDKNSTASLDYMNLGKEVLEW